MLHMGDLKQDGWISVVDCFILLLGLGLFGE